MTKLTKALITGVQPVFTSKDRSRHLDVPKNPLFASLSRQQLRLILPYLKQKEIRHSRPILEEGRRNASKIYIIISGQVLVAKQGFSLIEDGITTYEIGELRRGDIFGEVSFIDGRPSAVTYLAKSDVTLAVVDLSAAKWRPSARRVRNIVIAKLRRHLASRAHETITLQLESLRRENEFAAYRSGVGHIVVTALCLLSFYTFALSFLPFFKSFAHGNIALSPLIILLFALSFIPIIATSGFSLRFFGLQLDNWREALFFSLQASAIFLCGFLFAKWLLIETDPSFAGLALIDGARVESHGHSVPLTAGIGLLLSVISCWRLRRSSWRARAFRRRFTHFCMAAKPSGAGARSWYRTSFSPQPTFI
jgi:CRP-like cAMP-binding protein